MSISAAATGHSSTRWRSARRRIIFSVSNDLSAASRKPVAKLPRSRTCACSILKFRMRWSMFPDPWPKRRHHRRRLVTPEFLDSIHAALEETGFIRIATDQFDYFETIKWFGRRHPGFSMVDPNDLDLPSTKFETTFRDQGAPIYRLALRKISSVT